MSDSGCVAPDAFVREPRMEIDSMPGIGQICGQTSRRYIPTLLRIIGSLCGPMGPPPHERGLNVVILIT